MLPKLFYISHLWFVTLIIYQEWYTPGVEVAMIIVIINHFLCTQCLQTAFLSSTKVVGYLSNQHDVCRVGVAQSLVFCCLLCTVCLSFHRYSFSMTLLSVCFDWCVWIALL